MKRLRIWDPAAGITLACRPGLGEFFLRQRLVDEVIEIDKKSAAGRREALARLRAQEWGLILVPHQSVRTALWMLRLRASRGKIGFRTWWNRFIFDQRVTKPVDYPDALRQLSLMAPVDAKLAELFGTIEELKNTSSQKDVDYRSTPIPEWALMDVVKPGESSVRWIFLAPGSVWGTKRWTARGYTEVARALVERGYEVALVGSKDERPLCKQIAGAVPGVKNFAGKTSFVELVNILAGGCAMVANDSGAMHAAAAAGLPTVAVFGPTTLELGFRPWNDRAIVVQRELPCRPCGAHGPKVCPLGTHECMESISSAEVLSALDRLLGGGVGP